MALSQEEFAVNDPPYDGDCRISPRKGINELFCGQSIKGCSPAMWKSIEPHVLGTKSHSVSTHSVIYSI